MNVAPLVIFVISCTSHQTAAFLPALGDIGDDYLNGLFDICPQGQDSWNQFEECVEKESVDTDDPYRFCGTLNGALKCNDPVISSLRSCNHSADDLISLIEAHGKAFQFLCGNGGQRFSDLNTHGPLCALVNQEECPHSVIQKLNDHFVNETVSHSNYFNVGNCKLIKDAVDCFSTSASTCPAKTLDLIRSVNNIFLNAICAAAIAAAQK